MLQSNNQTPFTTRLSLFPDEDGVDSVYPVIKATFQMNQSIQLAEKQLSLIDADVYVGEPNISSLVIASETLPAKAATDVVVLGHAYAPDKTPRESVDVTLSVGSRGKTVRVYGDRRWKKGFFRFYPSRTEPFTKKALVYENAFGGSYQSEDREPIANSWNPIGKGFCPSKKSKNIKQLQLPNIEGLKDPLRRPGETPVPVGFGPICASWLPRLQYAGTYDEKWQKHRAPYLPEDFDIRFYNVAPEDQIFNPYLRGGEEVRIENATPDRELHFFLPRVEFNVSLRIAGRSEAVAVNLETVQIEPDESRLVMIWKGKKRCDKKTLKIEVANFEIKSTDKSVKGI